MTRRVVRADDAGPDDFEGQCEICGLEPHECTCAVCPVCGEKGRLACWRENVAANIAKLEAAIREHRDQRGDDRCFLDDAKLYSVLGDNVEVDASLPPKCDFLASCERYWEQRRSETTEGKPTIAQQDARIAELEAACKAALKALVFIEDAEVAEFERGWNEEIGQLQEALGKGTS